MSRAYAVLIGSSTGVPDAPTAVTSFTRDAGANVAFLPPADEGASAITHWVVVPYIGGSPQTATTVTVAAAGSITGSDGNTYVHVDVAGLTNSTDYTFRVKARNAQGDSVESDPSGVNTPLSGLVFGDHFNGAAGGPIHPEWWIYDRCGFLGQNEVAFYKPTHCVLDGSSHLRLRAEHIDTAGPRYPSDPQYPGTITQPWRSGSCQSNTRTWAPAAGNTMTYEARFQVNPHAGDGYWPGMFWLEGQLRLDDWKTDPFQGGWNSTDLAEIDVAEWFMTGDPQHYGNVSWAGTNEQTNQNAGIDLSAAQHTFAAAWKPGVNVKFYRDASLTATHTGQVPDSGAEFFLLLYLQMLAGGLTATEDVLIDYVRVYDQNLG